MDLTSRLRSIVRPSGSPTRELTYEPDTGRYEASIDLDRIADVLGGRVVTNGFGRALVIDRRYESDRFHGSRRVGECEVADDERLRLLDPTLPPRAQRGRGREGAERGAGVPASDRAGVWGGAPPEDATERGAGVPASDRAGVWGGAPPEEEERTIFVDLETTGLSGGAGTVAFLVGCGWFDMGAFQVRQFLLTSYASERALLDAVAHCFDTAALLVTYNGKTFDVPVMETRWMFHRMRMPLESVRHFDMLHPARRLWRGRAADTTGVDVGDEGGCRLGTLERVLCDVTRVGDVPGLEIPGRYFQFLRSGDARPLEPVLEHNRLDLISLAAVSAYAVQLVDEGHARCRDAAEALALAKVYERAGCVDRALAGYQLAADDPSAHVDVRAEAIYRLGVRLRRDRRFVEAAACWRRILDLKQARLGRRARLREGVGGQGLLETLRQYAVEALAIHHEHRERDYVGAKELTLQLLDETEDWVRPKTEQTRHRLARLERKLARRNDSQLFG